MSDSDTSDDSTDSDSDDQDTETTESTQTRHPLTNDIAALGVVLSFVGAVLAVSYGVATGAVQADIPIGNLFLGYIGLVLLAGVWLFGQDAFDAVRGLRGGGR